MCVMLCFYLQSGIISDAFTAAVFPRQPGTQQEDPKHSLHTQLLGLYEMLNVSSDDVNMETDD